MGTPLFLSILHPAAAAGDAWRECSVGGNQRPVRDSRGDERRLPKEEYARSRAAGKKIAGRGRGFSDAGGQTVAPARTGGRTQTGKAGAVGIRMGNGYGYPSLIPAARRSMDDAGGVGRREALHGRGRRRPTRTAWRGRRRGRAARRRRANGRPGTAMLVTAATRRQQGSRHDESGAEGAQAHGCLSSSLPGVAGGRNRRVRSRVQDEPPHAGKTPRGCARAGPAVHGLAGWQDKCGW
jgi:hypothetical protein